MIGERGDDDALPAGVGAGDPQRQVVRFRARAGEHHVRQVGREGREQRLGIIQHGVVQIARVGVDLRGLPGDRLHDMRMGVPHRGDVVVAVEVAVAVHVEQPGALAAHQVNGMFVEQPVGRAEQALPPLHHRPLAGCEPGGAAGGRTR